VSRTSIAAAVGLVVGLLIGAATGPGWFSYLLPKQATGSRDSDLGGTAPPDDGDEIVRPEGVEVHDADPHWPTRRNLRRLAGQWRFVDKDGLVTLRFPTVEGTCEGTLKVITAKGVEPYEFQVVMWMDSDEVVAFLYPRLGKSGLILRNSSLMLYATLGARGENLQVTWLLDPGSEGSWSGPQPPFSLVRKK